MSNLIVGVGTSQSKDAFVAGSEAVKKALLKAKGTCNVLIILASPAFDQEKLVDGLNSQAKKIPFIGGTTAGEISTIGFSQHSVVVMALGSSKLDFVTALSNNMREDDWECGRMLAQELIQRKGCREPLTLITFPDGLGGDGAKVIKGIRQGLGKHVEIVGGCLGDDTRFERTYQYFNGGLYTDTIPGLLICGNGDFETGIGVLSGFESIGNKFYCTEAKKNTVIKFDNEPALELYKEYLGEELSKRLPEICLEYPFGLIDEKVNVSGKEYFQLRAGLTVNEQNGEINLAGSIPKGSAITLTTASRGDIINGAKAAAMQAGDCLKNTNPRAILMLSCIGRRLVLGRRIDEEVEQVRDVLGKDVPIIGFYTYGEIGPINKMSEELAEAKYHNETVAIWVLGEK